VVEHRALRSTREAIHLDECSDADFIVVTTRTSVYELVVLRGEKGEVLVRGGNQFPEFCQARLTGSTAGGSALKLLTIDRGLRMEFQVGASMVVTTSPVCHLALHAADGKSQVCA
jgi:hypothetical protein